MEKPEDVDRADRPADDRPVRHRLTIIESVKKTGRVRRSCTRRPRPRPGRRDRALIQEHCFLHLEAPVQRVAGFDTIMPYYKLELDYLPDAGASAGDRGVLAY
jgi:2-oxoisovalerate dehydrogenase E1 component beta subunit